MAKNRETDNATSVDTAEPVIIAQETPVKVQIKLGIDFKPEEPRSRYWCGIVKGFEGRSYIGVAGVEFQQITDPPRLSKDGQTTTRNQYFGAIETLTDDEVAKISERVKAKVVRGGKIVNTDNVHQKPLPGDIPLARYLYMVRLATGYTPNRDTNGDTPEPMAQEGQVLNR